VALALVLTPLAFRKGAKFGTGNALEPIPVGKRAVPPNIVFVGGELVPLGLNCGNLLDAVFVLPSFLGGLGT